MAERKKRGIILGSTVCIFILAMALPFAQADEYDITNCGSTTITILYSSNELTILTLDGKGIAFSNHPNKTFDNATYQCVGVIRVAEGKAIATGYCKYLSPEEDIVVGEFYNVGPDGNWKFIHGTGKWKGIKGGGKSKPITSGKPITPGTDQSCLRATGTFELAK
jgi:hypothetical protein